MSVSTAESYRHCEQIARTKARNFYFSFVCLPKEKRLAMCAVYAFMRHSDDVSDDGGSDRSARMAAWETSLDRALSGDYGDSLILPAFHDTVTRYRIPGEYFHSLIEGTRMDLSPREYRTFEDTYRYCYHVASVVGLVCIHVFGFDDPQALRLAEYNGIAFQLTNILRDLREDAGMGRVYLPAEDFERFGYRIEQLKQGEENDAFRSLMQFEVERAREFYERAAPLEGLLHPESRPCFRAMRTIYRGILDQIVAQDYRVFHKRARVPTWRKVWIALAAWAESRTASPARAA